MKSKGYTIAELLVVLVIVSLLVVGAIVAVHFIAKFW